MKEVFSKIDKVITSILFWFSIGLFGTAIAVALLFGSVPTLASGPSMNPNFSSVSAQYMYWNFDKDDIERFDIIEADNPETTFGFVLKRIIGLPGEHIQITNDVLSVNGKIVEQPFDYIPADYEYSEDIILGENEYFVMGDNRANSNDSRFFGPITKEQIKTLYNAELSESLFGKITIPLLKAYTSVIVWGANGISNIITGEQIVPLE